jgi:hypothetical protein
MTLQHLNGLIHRSSHKTFIFMSYSERTRAADVRLVRVFARTKLMYWDVSCSLLQSVVVR